MDFLFAFLNRFVGNDTDPIDLLPLVVLAFLVVGVRHLRSLLLEVMREVRALRQRTDITQDVRSAIADLKKKD